jgi:hypothetical protein
VTVSPTASQSIAQPARRGRISLIDHEAATPAGRALQWLESIVMDAARSLTHLFNAHDRESLFDADCDARVVAAIAALDAGSALDARALLLEYRERDALRDAEHRAQREHAGVVRSCLRRIGQFIERSCKAIREARR